MKPNMHPSKLGERERGERRSSRTTKPERYSHSLQRSSIAIREFHHLGPSIFRSFAHRRVTMSGKAAQGAGKAVQKAKAIDWDYLQKVVVSDSGKRELAALRRAYDDVSATINDKFNVKTTNINWDFYKQKLGPSIVNIFQESVSSLDKEVPEYKDEYTADYQAKHQALMAKAAEQEEDSKKKIVALDKEIARVQEQKGAFKTMTVDEYFAKNPQSKEKIDDEIRNNLWGY